MPWTNRIRRDLDCVVSAQHGHSVTHLGCERLASEQLVGRAGRVVIGRAGKPVAVLIPWDEQREPRADRRRASSVWMADDVAALPPETADGFGGHKHE